MIKLRRRAIVRIVSYLLAFSISWGILVVSSEMKITELQSELTNEEIRSLNDISTYMDNIESTVLKGIYSSSDEALSAVAANLSAQTAAARYALGTLSNSGSLLDRTYFFLAQVSDFAAALSRKSGEDQKITEADAETLYTFMGYAQTIGNEISDLLSKVQSGEISIASDLSPNERSLSDAVGSSISVIDENFSEYPTLVYDGPFSDHIMNKEPLMTKTTEISSSAARAIAAEAIGADPAALSESEPTEGTMPAYNFSQEDTSVSVSRGGGYLIYMIKNIRPADIALSAEDAIIKAREYLSFIGYENMTESYYEISDGICYINFAAESGGVILYPDLVKIGISLENGETLSFDARGYLVNHTERNLPAPAISLEEAKTRLPSSVSVISSRLALTPGRDTEERLCYEFRCKGAREENLLIYVDALSGEEVSVLILLIGENGTLAI